VEEERKIKENEMRTAIALEQQRQQYIDLQGKNQLQEAEFRAKAMELEGESRGKSLEMELAPFRTIDPKTLLALGLRDIGLNAQKIGNLTITPEVLASLLNLRESHEAL
jgi:hypothetical protein